MQSKKRNNKNRKKHSTPKRVNLVKTRDENIEKILIENFVSLQGIFSNLAIKFSDLSNQISKLLNLFESSAKELAEKSKDFESEWKEKAEIKKKIDNILEQNRIIAKGISLLHENEKPVQSPQIEMQPKIEPTLKREPMPQQNELKISNLQPNVYKRIQNDINKLKSSEPPLANQQIQQQFLNVPRPPQFEDTINNQQNFSENESYSYDVQNDYNFNSSGVIEDQSNNYQKSVSSLDRLQRNNY